MQKKKKMDPSIDHLVSHWKRNSEDDHSGLTCTSTVFHVPTLSESKGEHKGTYVGTKTLGPRGDPLASGSGRHSRCHISTYLWARLPRTQRISTTASWVQSLPASCTPQAGRGTTELGSAGHPSCDWNLSDSIITHWNHSGKNIEDEKNSSFKNSLCKCQVCVIWLHFLLNILIKAYTSSTIKVTALFFFLSWPLWEILCTVIY